MASLQCNSQEEPELENPTVIETSYPGICQETGNVMKNSEVASFFDVSHYDPLSIADKSSSYSWSPTPGHTEEMIPANVGTPSAADENGRTRDLNYSDTVKSEAASPGCDELTSASSGQEGPCFTESFSEVFEEDEVGNVRLIDKMPSFKLSDQQSSESVPFAGINDQRHIRIPFSSSTYGTEQYIMGAGLTLKGRFLNEILGKIKQEKCNGADLQHERLNRFTDRNAYSREVVEYSVEKYGISKAVYWLRNWWTPRVDEVIRKVNLCNIDLPNVCRKNASMALWKSNDNVDKAADMIVQVPADEVKLQSTCSDLPDLVSVKHRGAAVKWFSFSTEQASISNDNVVEQRTSSNSLSIDDYARMIFADKTVNSWEQAQLAAELVCLKFSFSEAINAALHCKNLQQAFLFLQHHCEICTEKIPSNKMMQMVSCIHKACEKCMKKHFTDKIMSASILELTCPFCSEPDLANDPSEEKTLKYFSELDIVLKRLITVEVHELFQRKLRDYTLNKNPNFRWCAHCDMGFETDSRSQCIQCPSCKRSMCFHCKQPWDELHERKVCPAQQKSLTDTSDLPALLKRNVIDCPNCKHSFAISKGGCMHFICNSCSYSFCIGCEKQFIDGKKCAVSLTCKNKGLHAHHPRNCLFYLRDYEVAGVESLLEQHHVNYRAIIQEQLPEVCINELDVCQEVIQKSTHMGTTNDVICGKPTLGTHNVALCRTHYIEALGSLIWLKNIDPAPLLTEKELEAILQREDILVEQLRSGETSSQRRKRILCQVQTELPL